MPRVYTIAKEHAATVPTIFVPIKATRNPYNNAAAFCADLPNFFGGKVEDTHGRVIANPTPVNKIQTLNTELTQESQTRLAFNPLLVAGMLLAIHQTDATTPTVWDAPYDFYALDVDAIAAGAGGAGVVVAANNFVAVVPLDVLGVEGVEVLTLNPRPAGALPAGTASFYEYQCVVKIPNTAFASHEGPYPNNSLGLIQLCNAATNSGIAGLNAAATHARGQPVPANLTQFLGSETRIAFDLFLRDF